MITDKQYESELRKIKFKNIQKERKQKLKEEKNKYNIIHNFFQTVKTSNLVLFASIVAVITFTLISIVFQYKTGEQLSDTLTERWYTFWTVEIVSLCGIKVSKVFKNYDSKFISEDPMVDDIDNMEE